MLVSWAKYSKDNSNYVATVIADLGSNQSTRSQAVYLQGAWKNKELYQFIKDSTQIQSIIDEISTDKYAQIFIVDKNERELY